MENDLLLESDSRVNCIPLQTLYNMKYENGTSSAVKIIAFSASVKSQTVVYFSLFQSTFADLQ